MAPKTVLLIDDDGDDRSLFFEALLEAEPSCVFVSAIDGEQGLHMLALNEVPVPNIIFLDLNMPKMNGWQCLKLIRELQHLGTVPVVIYSTSRKNEAFENVLRLGNVHYFTKPQRYNDLLRGFRRILKEEWSAIDSMNEVAYG
jgi:CheY-like chemotaxis protein